MVVALQNSPFAVKQVSKPSDLRPSGWFGGITPREPAEDDVKSFLQTDKDLPTEVRPSSWLGRASMESPTEIDLKSSQPLEQQSKNSPEFDSVRPSGWLGYTPPESPKNKDSPIQSFKKPLADKRIYASENYQELGGSRPSEWLGRASNSHVSPNKPKSPEKNISARYVSISNSDKKKLAANPLDEIRGSPVKNSPFLSMQKTH